MPIRVDLTMHGSSFKNRHFVWSRAKDLLKLNNTINKPNSILYYSLSLNTCECYVRFINRIVID